MTLEKLEARKVELQKQQAQILANVNALAGAIQDCDFWIEQLKQTSSPVSSNP